MARYRLLSQHFSEEDKLLEPGTEVGDGCEHLWTRPPTVEMLPLDEDGMDAVARERSAEEVGNPAGRDRSGPPGME